MDFTGDTFDSFSVDECLAGGNEMGVLMGSIDWSKTLLGPVAGWTASLRTSVSICLNSRFPILLWWGPELIMLYNDAYRPILGATKHPTALGQRGRECWPEIWGIIGPMLDGVLYRGQATWSEDLLLILERNGYPEECYFTFSYSPIHDENLGTAGVFTAVSETTRRVISERRMETLQNLTVNTSAVQTLREAGAAVIQAMRINTADLPFALLYLDEAGSGQLALAGASGIQASQPAAATTGWPLAEVQQTRQAVLVEDLAERFPELDHQVQAHQVRKALVLPVTRPAQEAPYGCLVVGLSPIRALDEGYRSFLELVTGQIAAAIANVQALEEERQRAEALARLDQAKTEFFSNVSHEFRTPLTLILGPIQEALETHQTAAQRPPVEGSAGGDLAVIDRAALEMANRNGQRLLKLVNTLLDFSRIEAGRVEAVYEPTDLAQLTTGLASIFRAAIERAGLHLRVECDPLPEPVFVDREMWEKIVLNLLSNAFKYTFEGVITIQLGTEGSHVVLAVRDTGVGIQPDDLPHVFERFYRGNKMRSRTQEGSGIGLALVKELVQLHGGTIAVHSQPGKGSMFTVTIPRGFAHLPAERINARRARLSTAVTAASFVDEALRWLPDTGGEPVEVTGEGTELARLTLLESGHRQPVEGRTPAREPAYILVVDDNADLREYLKRLLWPRWQVETAADGLSALEAARRRVPDVVVTDVMMPGLDGFELLKALRQEALTRDVPVILLSARAGEEARLEGLQGGADDYLVKPFSARELVARVEARLEMKAQRKAAEENLTGILRELQRSNRELENFAQIASHDLQEPLRKIQAFGTFLQDQLQGKLAQEELEYFGRMQNAAGRMSLMINDLLEYSRISLQAHPITQVDLNETVAEVLDDLDASLEHSRGQVNVDELPTISSNPQHMQQLFQHLIGNALKFHRSKLPPVVKIYTGEETPQWVEVVVKDNGIGFPSEQAERIFQPFQRLHGRFDYEGNGIGLAICRRIVECYDGTIRAQSKEGHGATFTIRFLKKERLPQKHGESIHR